MSTVATTCVLPCLQDCDGVVGRLPSETLQQATLNLPEHSSDIASFLCKQFTSTSKLHFRKELITSVQARAEILKREWP
jgi:hypothetical protein